MMEIQPAPPCFPIDLLPELFCLLWLSRLPSVKHGVWLPNVEHAISTLAISSCYFIWTCEICKRFLFIKFCKNTSFRVPFKGKNWKSALCVHKPFHSTPCGCGGGVFIGRVSKVMVQSRPHFVVCSFYGVQPPKHTPRTSNRRLPLGDIMP